MKKICILLSMILTSCSSIEKMDYSSKTDIEIYEQGIRNLNKGNNISAKEDFKEIEYNHPYSQLVGKSWILSGYSSYKEKKYQEAIDSFEKLIKYQPNNPEIPYALYMIGISYYDQMSPISRDQKMTELALSNMEKLVKLYPESEYAKDVLPKIRIARNNLAAKEMYIAKNQIKKQNIIAGLNRYQTIIAKYQTSLFIEEALYRTIEIYLLLEEPEEAKNMLRLLEENYPNSSWYTDGKKLVENYENMNIRD